MRNTAKLFSDIFKFNPYHDEKGWFATADNATSFTYKPGKSKSHDLAIQREKDRMAQAKNIVSITSKNADYILNRGGVITGKKEAAKQLNDFYEETAMKNGIKWDAEKQKVVISRSHMAKMKDVARDIMSKQEYEDNSTADDYRQLHQYIKRTPVKISDYDKQNIPDWNDYRKRAFGNLTISRNGIPIDSLYEELTSQFPHLFNSKTESNPADQLQHINDTLKGLKPKTYKLSGKELESATDDLALVMLKGYIAGITNAA